MKYSITIGLVILLMLTVVACDQGESLQDAIARAITKTGEAGSYRSAGNGTTYDENITYEFSFELYAAPDRWYLLQTALVDGGESVTVTTTVDYGNFTVASTVTATGSWTETIVVGDKGYVRSQREPQWRVCEVYTPDWQPPPPGPTPGTGTCQVSFQTSDKQLELLNYLVELEKLPDEEIDGVNCSHYRGRLDQDSVVDMLRKRDEEAYGQIPPEYLEMMRQYELFVELWIDGDDYIRQQRTEFRFPEPDSTTGDEKWVTGFSTTQYFDFNEAIPIEPPEIE